MRLRSGNEQRMQEIISWIIKEEAIRLIPVLDRLLVIFLRSLYVGGYYSLRFSLRLVPGKKKRDDFFSKNQIRVIFGLKLDYVLLMGISNLLNLVKETFKCNENFLLKITVPRYNYKAYCPTNRNDLINLSIREDEIIELFRPKEGHIVVDVEVILVGIHLLLQKGLELLER